MAGWNIASQYIFGLAAEHFEGDSRNLAGPELAKKACPGSENANLCLYFAAEPPPPSILRTSEKPFLANSVLAS